MLAERGTDCNNKGFAMVTKQNDKARNSFPDLCAVVF